RTASATTLRLHQRAPADDRPRAAVAITSLPGPLDREPARERAGAHGALVERLRIGRRRDEAAGIRRLDAVGVLAHVGARRAVQHDAVLADVGEHRPPAPAPAEAIGPSRLDATLAVGAGGREHRLESARQQVDDGHTGDDSPADCAEATPYR